MVVPSASGARRPATGQRLEDESPQGQNLAQPGFGSRQPCPEGVKLKPNLPEIAIQLRDRMVAKGFAKQALHHHRGRALKKMLLTTHLKLRRINVNNSRPTPQST